MRCSKARKMISDYVDRNLDAKKKSALELHLERCPDCQLALKDFKTIVENAQELEAPSPSSQAWLRIKARLNEVAQTAQAPELPKRKWHDFLLFQPKLKYALSSALVLVVIVGGVILGIRYFKGEVRLGGNNHQKYTLAKLKEAERHYQLAIKALAEAVSSQEESLDPQVAQIFRANLEIIDASIKACKKAVLDEPENVEARNYLLFAYREKLGLLDEIIAARSSSPRKRDLRKTI